MSVVLIFCVVVVCAYFIQTKYRVYLIGRKLAGPWALPLIGNIQMMAKIKPEYLFVTITEYRRKYGEAYRLWLGTQLWVFLHTPEETRDALNDSSLLRADTFNQLSVLIGNGLLLSHGKFWETHRRALGPAFHPNILNSFTEEIDLHAETLVKKLKNSQNRTMEATEYLFPCIMDIIFDTSMGKQLRAQDDPECVYTHAFHNASQLLFERMVNPMLGFDFVYRCTKSHGVLQKSLNTIHELMDRVIQERAQFLEERGQHEAAAVAPNTAETIQHRRRQRTLLDTLLTAQIDGSSLSLQEIRDEVNTFVFAGVDTTTAAMSFILYSLAKYPETQEKLLQEIYNNRRGEEAVSSPLSSPPPASTILTIADIQRLEYLDMFIKECLRFYTIVPLTGRQTTNDDTKIGRMRYCRGITLWINMYGLAHDEAFFERPFEFRPERFSRAEQRRLPLPPFCFIPFSGGPHVCIGRKYALLIMKILTVKILHHFEVKLSHPSEELVLMAQMVLKSLNGIQLIFKSR